MARLTFKEPNGLWGIVGMNEQNQEQKTYGALNKLLEYEETGLDPVDIYRLDKLYLEKCQEVNRLEDEIKLLKGEQESGKQSV